MRSVLVALDDTPGGAAAVAFAVALAKRGNARLTGASVLDIDYLTAPEPGGVGTAYYKFKADLARLKRGHERSEKAAAEFLRRCESETIERDVLALEGSPAAVLYGAAATHDLVVIGQDCDFHGERGGGLAKSVVQILKGSARPLVITPDAVHDPGRVVVAYDGSGPAARALQIAVLLGLTTDAEVHVVAVRPEEEEADRFARQAGAYLSLYGCEATLRPTVARADPAELVIAEARALEAGLLVMGAYGHRGWREALLGSFTTRMLSQCPTALFIHH